MVAASSMVANCGGECAAACREAALEARGPAERRLRRTMRSTSAVSGGGVHLSGSKGELEAGKSDTSRSYEKQASSILFMTRVLGLEDCECAELKLCRC